MARSLHFVVAAALLAIAWPWIDAVQYDRRVESLLPASDPAVQAFVEMRNQFGGTDSVVVVWREPKVLDPTSEAIERVVQMHELLNAPDEILINGTLSLIELDNALKRMLIYSKHPIQRPDMRTSFIFRELFSGYTHSADGNWASIIVLFEPDVDHDVAIEHIRAIATKILRDSEPFYIVGEPAIIVEGMSMLEADGVRLARNVLVLLSVTLLLLLRRPMWILVVIMVVLWSRWMTRAVLAASGIKLTMISGMLDAVLAVVAVATVMHLALRFTTEASRHLPHVAAGKTWRQLFPPVFWSLTTTAIGFLSLASSSIIPVKQFGLMMALGTFFVFIGVLLICPAFMNAPFSRRSPAVQNRWLRRKLLQVLAFVTQRAYATASLALLLGLVSLVGVMQLQVETNFLNNFRSDSEIVKAYKIVEENLGGAGVWDVVVPAPESLTNEYLKLVFYLEKELRLVESDSGAKITKIVSIADADLAAKEHSKVIDMMGPTVRLASMQAVIPAFYEALVNVPPSPGASAETSALRILVRSNEQATATEKLQLIERVNEVAKRHVQSDAWQAALTRASDGKPDSRPAKVTGYFVLMTRLVAGLLQDQWTSFFLASVGIVICVWLATRRIALAIAATLPSILPILFVLGIVGVTGQRVNLGAAMIAAVSVGLSIDGSIHYLNNYRQGRSAGKSQRRALQQAQRSTGLAVSIATIALAAGLLTLLASPLKPTAAFGLLTGMTLLAGLIGNLVLLPALVVIVSPGLPLSDLRQQAFQDASVSESEAK